MEQKGTGNVADLRSKMSGWQKCLNAITNLTFHITSKRQSLSQLESKSTCEGARDKLSYIRAMLNRPPNGLGPVCVVPGVSNVPGWVSALQPTSTSTLARA